MSEVFSYFDNENRDILEKFVNSVFDKLHGCKSKKVTEE